MNWLRHLSLAYTLTSSLAIQPLLCSSEVSSTIDSCQIWSQGNKHFTTTFYPYLTNSEPNLVFSPISLQVGLAMTAELASGATQEEILEKAILPSEESIRLLGVEKILATLNPTTDDPKESIQLNLTNSAWLSSKIPFRSSIKEILNHYYQSELYQSNFHLLPEGEREAINAWVEENTQHQIQELLPKGSIDKFTQVVLVNTLYMHAPWAYPFSPEMTYEALFYGIENHQSMASYMQGIGNFPILQEANATIIELPFKQSGSHQQALSFFVVLPRSGFPLSELEKQLTTRKLDHWITSTTPAYINLSLPKFKVSSNFNAKKALQEMGLQRPFSHQAEFNLTQQEDHVMITDVVHQAVFEVDEQGGTGSAATGIVIGIKSCLKIPKTIIVNRPFLFFVADKTTGMILFAGRILQPSNH